MSHTHTHTHMHTHTLTHTHTHSHAHAHTHTHTHTHAHKVVRKDRTLEKIVFPIPTVCHFLTEESKANVMENTECNEQGSKVDDFFTRTDDLYKEMECQKDLRGETQQTILLRRDRWKLTNLTLVQ